MGTQLSPERGTAPPNFGPCLLWPNGSIRIRLGTEVGLAPADFAFDGDPAPPGKRAPPRPIFGTYPLSPNGWMDLDATGYGCKLRPRRRCVGLGLSSPHKRSTAASFQLMSIVAKWLDG